MISNLPTRSSTPFAAIAPGDVLGNVVLDGDFIGENLFIALAAVNSQFTQVVEAHDADATTPRARSLLRVAESNLGS